MAQPLVKQDNLSKPRTKSHKLTTKSRNNYNAKSQASLFSHFTRIHKAQINKPKSKIDPIQFVVIKGEDDFQPNKTIEQANEQ